MDVENTPPPSSSPRSPVKVVRNTSANASLTAKGSTHAAPIRVYLLSGDATRVGLVYVTDRASVTTLAGVRKLMQEQLGEEHAARISFEVDGCPIAVAQEQFEPFSSSLTTELKVRQRLDACADNEPTKRAKTGSSLDELASLDELEAREKAEAEPKKPAAEDEKKPVEDQRHFKVSRKTVEVTDCAGKPTGETEEEVNITITDAALKESLRRVTGLALFYEAEPTVSASALLPHITEIGAANGPPSAGKPGMASLGAFLNAEFAAVKHKMDAMLDKGVVSFDALWYLFSKGTEFVATVDECLVGSAVEESRYQRSFFSNDFLISAQLVRTNGRNVGMAKKSFSVGAYRGVTPIKDLPIRPIAPEEKAELEARGKTFRAHAVGCHYLAYAGNGSRRNWCCTTRYKADGRVVVDGANFARFNPNYNMGLGGPGRGADEQAGGLGDAGIEDAMLWRCWHSVFGFSLSAKKWLELRVDGLAAVRFDDDAYERLVLSAERKALVRALVTQGGGGGGAQFADIISGKGGGCIFLLHGSPGTGKTLTAEAIAELLHRPLYSVGVGELGVSCSELEEKLREILEVASAWDAVVLIDEADIFLEKRSENDIHRNAMVGVFLRLLEYHQGVLFLTTNRVRSFDEAFHSRISVALRYEPLGAPARAEVWSNLLAAAAIGGLDAAELAKYELNGRQIKNTIRLAQSLAATEGVQVNAAHVARTVGVTAQFQTDIKGAAD